MCIIIKLLLSKVPETNAFGPIFTSLPIIVPELIDEFIPVIHCLP